MYDFSWLSLTIVAAAGLVNIIGRQQRKTWAFRYSLVILSSAVFVALVLVYYPFVHADYLETYQEDNIKITVITLMQCIQGALRTFVLDGEWADFIRNGAEISPHASIIGLLLNIMAPVLTFSAILSMFNEIRSRYRLFKMSIGGHDLAIMSELNDDSICLAEDIIRKNKKAGVVFTDVYPEDDESNFELKEKAKKINAVFLRTDISELEIRERNALTEYFIIGHDEEENVMQAEKLFRRNEDREQTSIFVRAVHESNAVILDSIGASIKDERFTTDGRKNDLTYVQMKNRISDGRVIKFRRFDPELEVAWREIPEMNFLKEAFNGQADPDKILSVLVIANTHFAFTIVRTLLWYCQSDKFKLKLNIVYTDRSKLETVQDESESWPADIRYLLEQECPDIICTNKKCADGDAYYDIEFFEIDEFEEMYNKSPYGTEQKDPEPDETLSEAEKKRLEEKRKEQARKWARIKSTAAVIIDTQNDVTTIETALKVRTAFTRAVLLPEIYAVCTDDQNILAGLNGGDGRSAIVLSTYKKDPYGITFIGKRSDIYKYDNFRNTENDRQGFIQHIKWSSVHEKNSDFRSKLISYEQREYNRLSSMSKAIYLRNAICIPPEKPDEQNRSGAIKDQTAFSENQNAIDDTVKFEKGLRFRDEYKCEKYPDDPEKRWECRCSKCILRRKIEHNRWNAYMRTIGYKHEVKPALAGNTDVEVAKALAKVHADLVPFNKLGDDEILKDS
ncbi:MAG: hypothetical protein IJH43_02575 [Mogibacterium sp.]|nr:hypothetical protein [Mogibacterium sp.]